MFSSSLSADGTDASLSQSIRHIYICVCVYVWTPAKSLFFHHCLQLWWKAQLSARLFLTFTRAQFQPWPWNHSVTSKEPFGEMRPEDLNLKAFCTRRRVKQHAHTNSCAHTQFVTIWTVYSVYPQCRHCTSSEGRHSKNTAPQFLFTNRHSSHKNDAFTRPVLKTSPTESKVYSNPIIFYYPSSVIAFNFSSLISIVHCILGQKCPSTLLSTIKQI